MLVSIMLLLLARAEQASAFEYAGQAWCCDTIYYYINPTNPSSVCGGPIIGPWFQSRINTAATAWNSQGTAFVLVNLGTTSVSCYSAGQYCQGYKDGQNTISMATGCSWVDSNIIAYSTWWYWTGGDSMCCIFESDICFNNNVMWYCNAGSPCSGSCYDLISVAEHEIGHWIASNHENHNSTLGYKPIMYFAFNYCEMRRTVTPDDSALIHWAYDPYGNISFPSRCATVHYHPPYPTAPPHDYCWGCDCRPGEANNTGTYNILDITYLINNLYQGGPSPVPYALCSGDANCNCVNNLLDITYLINYIYRGGNPPCSCEAWLSSCGPPLRK
jgi:hypothetical protein